MDEIREIKVSKNTQKFVKDLADLPSQKQRKVLELLDALSRQQDSEANLEHKRGWRHMWERTPKPYLLMLGYLVFLAPVGSIGFQAFSTVNDDIKIIYLIVLGSILILPLLVVFFLSYHYVTKAETF